VLYRILGGLTLVLYQRSTSSFYEQKSQKKQRRQSRLFHGFGQGKFAYGGLILGLSQFLLLPQLPLKKWLKPTRNNHLTSLIKIRESVVFTCANWMWQS